MNIIGPGWRHAPPWEVFDPHACTIKINGALHPRKVLTIRAPADSWDQLALVVARHFPFEWTGPSTINEIVSFIWPGRLGQNAPPSTCLKSFAMCIRGGRRPLLLGGICSAASVLVSKSGAHRNLLRSSCRQKRSPLPQLLHKVLQGQSFFAVAKLLNRSLELTNIATVVVAV